MTKIYIKKVSFKLFLFNFVVDLLHSLLHNRIGQVEFGVIRPES